MRVYYVDEGTDNNYIDMGGTEVFGREFQFVKNDEQALGVCYLSGNKPYLIDEQFCETESNYEYFTNFLFAFAGLKDFRITNDAAWAADYVKEVFDIIDEVFGDDKSRVDYDDLVALINEYV